MSTDMDIALRAEAPADIDAIELLTMVAFFRVEHSRHDEQRIIAALRADGALSVSLVAEHDGYVVGHAAASPVTISDGSRGWYGLGPVAVGPGHQRHRIGSRLVAAVLDALRERGAAGCVVLGEPGFYGRFGFAQEPGLLLPGVPASHFLALPFGDRLPPLGEVEYHAAFSA